MTVLCRVAQVQCSSYYDWRKCPAKLISAEELQFYRRAKALFNASQAI
jgi:putative transposase